MTWQYRFLLAEARENQQDFPAISQRENKKPETYYVKEDCEFLRGPDMYSLWLNEMSSIKFWQFGAFSRSFSNYSQNPSPEKPKP